MWYCHPWYPTMGSKYDGYTNPHEWIDDQPTMWWISSNLDRGTYQITFRNQKHGLDNNGITILAGLYFSTFWGFVVYQIMFYVKQISPRPGDSHNPRYQGTVLRVHQPRGNGLLHLMGI